MQSSWVEPMLAKTDCGCRTKREAAKARSLRPFLWSEICAWTLAAPLCDEGGGGYALWTMGLEIALWSSMAGTVERNEDA